MADAQLPCGARSDLLSAEAIAALEALAPSPQLRRYTPAEDEALRRFAGRKRYADLSGAWMALFGIARTAEQLRGRACALGIVRQG